MTNEIPEIPNTPEQMFPGSFDVYTIDDAARELLLSGDTMTSAELLVGPPERLGTIKIERKTKAQQLLSSVALKFLQFKINIKRQGS